MNKIKTKNGNAGRVGKVGPGPGNGGLGLESGSKKGRNRGEVKSGI